MFRCRRREQTVQHQFLSAGYEDYRVALALEPGNAHLKNDFETVKMRLQADFMQKSGRPVPERPPLLTENPRDPTAAC